MGDAKLRPTRLLALDLDGTVFEEDALVPGVESVLADLRAANWAVAIITARWRTPPGVLALRPDAVTRNYGVIVDVRSRRKVHLSFNGDLTARLLEACPAAGRLHAFAEATSYASVPDSRWDRPLHEAGGDQVMKVLYRGAYANKVATRWQALPGVTVVREDETKVCAVPQGACKGCALRHIASALGVPTEHILRRANRAHPCAWGRLQRRRDAARGGHSHSGRRVAGIALCSARPRLAARRSRIPEGTVVIGAPPRMRYLPPAFRVPQFANGTAPHATDRLRPRRNAARP